MTEFIHRAFLIVNGARQAAQRTRWKTLGPAGNAEAGTFTAPLSSDGSLPATHFGASSAFTDTMRRRLTNNNTGLKYYVVDSQGILRFTNSGTAIPGRTFTWEDVLTDMGLQPITPSL